MSRYCISDRWRGVVLVVLGVVLTAAAAGAGEYQRVQVASPYLELHTGAGRSFPVFHVVERGAWLEIVKRRTDWFKVRTAAGKVGWVDRAQMETTLTEAGVARSFRDVLLRDYLARHLEVGIGAGLFESDPVTTVRVGYRVTENFLIEASFAQVSGDFSSTQLYHGNVVILPFPEWRFSPELTVGGGHFHNVPRATLVDDQTTDAEALNAGVGGRIYLSRRFVARVGFREYVVLVGDDQTDTYHEWLAGLSFFF